jgi:hypothetical protein
MGGGKVMEELKITRERAIKRMEWILKHEIYCSDKLSHAAINMAITALRSTEPENKPLTLEQFNRMGGDPVWIQRGRYGKWRVVKEIFRECVYFTDSGPTGLKFSDYGKTWIAYARKPKGSETNE